MSKKKQQRAQGHKADKRQGQAPNKQRLDMTSNNTSIHDRSDRSLILGSVTVQSEATIDAADNNGGERSVTERSTTTAAVMQTPITADQERQVDGFVEVLQVQPPPHAEQETAETQATQAYNDTNQQDQVDQADQAGQAEQQPEFVPPQIVAIPKTSDNADMNDSGTDDEDSSDSESESGGITLQSRTHDDDDFHRRSDRTVETVYVEDTNARIEANAASVATAAKPAPAPTRETPAIFASALPVETENKAQANRSVSISDDSSKDKKCFLYSNILSNTPDPAIASVESPYTPPVEGSIVLANGLSNVLIRTNVSSSILLPENFTHEGTLVITNVFEGVHHRVTTRDDSVIDGGAIRWFVLRGGTTVTLLFMRTETESSWWRLSEVYRAQSMQLFAPPTQTFVPSSSKSSIETQAHHHTAAAPHHSAHSAHNQTIANVSARTPITTGAVQEVGTRRHESDRVHERHERVEEKKTIRNEQSPTQQQQYTQQQQPPLYQQQRQQPMQSPATARVDTSRATVPSVYHQPNQSNMARTPMPMHQQQPSQRTITKTYYKPSTTFFGLPNPFKPPIRVTTTIPIEDLSSESLQEQ